MRSLLPKLLFYYSALASFLITVSTIFTTQTIGPVIFAVLFLPVTAYFTIEFFKQMRSILSPKPVEGSDIGSSPKKAEFLIMTFIFLLLLGVGIRNIMVSSGNAEEITASPVTVPTPTPLIFKTTEKTLGTITVKITDRSPMVNIRQKPTTYSEKTGEAKDGDSFEYTSLNAGWYGIKLKDGSVGYISGKYAEETAQ